MDQQHFRIGLLREGAIYMSCSEARCPSYEHGWVVVVDEGSDLGQRQAHYIRYQSGRGFVEFPSQEASAYLEGEGLDLPPGLTVFKFYAGQQCFARHLDREVLFVHEKAGQRRLHARPQDFIEDWNEEAYRANRALERG